MTQVPPSQDLDPDAVAALANAVAPIIAERLMSTPTYWGSPSHVHAAPNVSLVNTLFNVSSGHVYIEDFVFFGHNVCVLTGTHEIDKYGLERWAAVPGSGRDIHIGWGAWIASNATILGPCRIGRDAVIGVGSVVMGDVRPGWFYAGTPARPIKPVSARYADPSLGRKVARMAKRLYSAVRGLLRGQR